MKTKSLIILMTFALALAFAACDSDDDDGGTTTPQDTVTGEDNVEPGTDTVDPGTDTTDPGTDTVAGTDTAGGDDTAEPAGACTNETDGPIIEAHRDEITGIATTCGLNCTNDGDPLGCSTTCIQNDMKDLTGDDTTLTAECSACYVGIIGCTMDNCLIECVADPASEGCQTCQWEKDCYPQFYECSGLEEPAE